MRAKQGMAHVAPEALDWVPIDPERLKRVYDDLVAEFEVHVLFHTMLSAVRTDGHGRVECIVTTNKSGLRARKAKVFIDCSGDADLVAWAGSRFHKGDAEGKGLMPATHCFILSNVDEPTYLASPPLHLPVPENPIFKILESRKFPLLVDAHCCQNLVGPGTVGFNAGHIFDVDNTDPESTSKALAHGRRLAAQFCEALREFHPAFRNAFLVAGRSISTEKAVQGSIRVMPVCLAMGEAAGLAAAMAVDAERAPREIDTGSLRARLKIHGAYLPG